MSRCRKLIDAVLFGNHSDQEWRELKMQFHAIVDTASQEEIEQIEDSGIGEMLSMICSE